MGVSITVDEPDIDIVVNAYDGYSEVTGISAPLVMGDVQSQKGAASVADGIAASVVAGDAQSSRGASSTANGITAPVVAGDVQSQKGDGSTASGIVSATVIGNVQSQRGDGSTADGISPSLTAGDASSQKGDTSQADGIAAPLVMGEVQTEHLKPAYRWQMPLPRNLLSDPENFNPDTTAWEELNLLPDFYPGAAAAYSLRKLRSGYSGNAIRVRRSLDNSEQNFTPTEVTDGTLESFCGSGDGFIVTKNDQTTGSNEENQSTETNQPKIVSSGTLISDGIEYDGSDDFLISDQTIALSDFSISLWTKNTETDDFAGFISTPAGDPRLALFYRDNRYSIGIRDANGNGDDLGGSETVNDGVLHHIVVTYDSTNDDLKTYFDGNKDLDRSFGTTSFNIDRVMRIGTEITGGVFLQGHIRQVVIYDRVLSKTEAQGIFNNFAPPQL